MQVYRDKLNPNDSYENLKDKDLTFSTCEEFKKQVENIKNNKNLDENTKLDYLEKLKLNYPGLEIFSNFDYGDDFIYSVFSGIKELNDIYGQIFVNKITDQFKEYLIKEQTQIFGDYFIWNDYKNLLSKIPKSKEDITIEEKNNDLNNKLFELYEKEYDKLNSEKKEGKEKIEKDNFSLKINIKKGKIESHDEDKNLYANTQISIGKIKNKLEIEQFGLEHGYIDFMEGEYKNEFIKKFKSNFEEHLNDGEFENNNKSEKIEFKIIKNKKGKYILSHKYFKKNYEGKYELSNFEKTPVFFNGKLNEKIINLFYDGKIPKELGLYKNLINTYYVENFKHILNEEYIDEESGKIYTTVEKNADGNNIKEKEGEFLFVYDKEDNRLVDKIKIFNNEGNFFSRDLLSKVRKNKLPNKLAIFKKVKKIINLLISDFEFFFPEWDNVSSYEYIKKVDEYKKIKKNIEEGNQTDSDINFIHTYYKNTQPEYKFFENIENKEGQMIFIDIRGMGETNIKDFHNKAKDILSSTKQSDKEKKHNNALLKSGEEATEKFKELLKIIKEKYPSVYQISGADEAPFFLEGEKNHRKIIGILQKEADKIGLKLRITTAYKEKYDEPEEVLDEIDKESIKSKNIEILNDFINKRIKDINHKITSQEGNLSESIQILNNLGVKKYKMMDAIIELKEYILKKILNSSIIINKKKIALKNLENFYISIKEGEDILHIGKKEFNLKDILNENGNFITESDFFRFLDKNKIGREIDK